MVEEVFTLFYTIIAGLIIITKVFWEVTLLSESLSIESLCLFMSENRNETK